MPGVVTDQTQMLSRLFVISLFTSCVHARIINSDARNLRKHFEKVAGNLLTWNPCGSMLFGIVCLEFSMGAFVKLDSVTGNSKIDLVGLHDIFDLREKGIFLLNCVVFGKAHPHVKIIRTASAIAGKFYFLETIKVCA